MTRFYVVRHGETLFNIKRLYQGWCDSTLTENGILQAKELYEGLYAIPFVNAVSSTSERAIDTLACIVGDRNIPMEWDKDLREVYFGQKEGDYYPDTRPSADVDWIGYDFCGGETRDEACDRFLHGLARHAVDGNVLVVSHGAVICRFIQRCVPDLWAKRNKPNEIVPNCSVTLIDYEQGQFHLAALPDISYRKK
jgi:probable phosphoglycerate mutase